MVRFGAILYFAHQRMVLHEALYQKRERFNYIFIRTWNPETGSYTVKLQGFGLSPYSAKRVRTNVSLISWAAQYDVPLAKQLASTLVVSIVNVVGRFPINEQQQIKISASLFSFRPTQCFEAMLLRLINVTP